MRYVVDDEKLERVIKQFERVLDGCDGIGTRREKVERLVQAISDTEMGAGCIHAMVRSVISVGFDPVSIKAEIDAEVRQIITNRRK